MPRQIVKLYPDEISLDYLAGMVDGDGCIGICKDARPRRANPFYWVRLGVTNSNKALLDDLQSQFGGSISKDGRKSAGSWYIDGKKAKPLLTKLYPLLRIKGEQALVGLRLLDLKELQGGHSGIRSPEWDIIARDELYLECQALNNGGKAFEW